MQIHRMMSLVNCVFCNVFIKNENFKFDSRIKGRETEINTTPRSPVRFSIRIFGLFAIMIIIGFEN